MDTPAIDTSTPLMRVSLCGEGSSASPRKRQTVSSPPTVDERASRRAAAPSVTRESARPALPAGRAAHVRADWRAVAVLTTSQAERHGEGSEDLHPPLCIPHRYRVAERVSGALIRRLAAQRPTLTPMPRDSTGLSRAGCA